MRGNKHFELGQEFTRRAYANQGTRDFKRFRLLAAQEFRKAAYAGHMDAQWSLGLEYDETGVLGENRKKAFYWYMKAAQQGQPDACNSVGAAYYRGYGVPQDKKLGNYWFKKGADLGNELARENLDDAWSK